MWLYYKSWTYVLNNVKYIKKEGKNEIKKLNRNKMGKNKTDKNMLTLCRNVRITSIKLFGLKTTLES